MAIDLNQYWVDSQAWIIQYSTFIISFILIVFGLKITEKFLVRYIKKFAKKSKNDLDDIAIEFMESLPWWFFLFASIWISSKIAQTADFITRAVDFLFIIFAVYFAVKFLTTIVNVLSNKEIKRRKKTNGEDIGVVQLLATIIKVAIWVIALVLILSNFGVNVNSLIAGIGIGGIAIAFALQNVLEDLFSAFTIYFDKPFKVGDFIIIGSDMGTIKHVGLKTTRIQTLQGQELVVSNRELTSTRINNYKQMEQRRIMFGFGVEYGTKSTKMKKVNKIVADIFKGIKLARLDRVHFKEFADSSLNYEVIYYLDSSDYNVYMDTQQDINFKIKDALEKEKIEMAFPTRTVHIVK